MEKIFNKEKYAIAKAFGKAIRDNEQLFPRYQDRRDSEHMRITTRLVDYFLDWIDKDEYRRCAAPIQPLDGLCSHKVPFRMSARHALRDMIFGGFTHDIINFVNETIEERPEYEAAGMQVSKALLAYERAYHPAELALKFGRIHLTIQECDLGYDYSHYDNDYQLIDGGQYESDGESIFEVVAEILKELIPNNQIIGVESINMEFESYDDVTLAAADKEQFLELLENL